MAMTVSDCPTWIIPARAGSRSPTRSARRRTTDHPRACGEQRGVLGFTDAALGSSPRVRGAASRASGEVRSKRIIPARAGSSRCSRCVGCPSWDHPRACGEQPEVVSMPLHAGGSSPRVRGAGHDKGSDASAVGIIPARAGSSPIRIR